MAIDLINAISAIPSSPDEGDIIRFSTSITSGIPNIVKKANGTTRETSIIVGGEYRYIGTNWLKIGGDEIQTTPLKDATVLVESEFENMIMGAVHNSQNSGRLRQLGASILHQALQAANPLSLQFENDIIFENDINSSGTYNLDIRTGSTPYTFTDYQSLVFESGTSPIDTAHATYLIPRSVFETEYDSSRPLRVAAQAGGNSSSPEIYRVSNTSFYCMLGNNAYSIQKIIGIKVNLNLETPV